MPAWTTHVVTFSLQGLRLIISLKRFRDGRTLECLVTFITLRLSQIDRDAYVACSPESQILNLALTFLCLVHSHFLIFSFSHSPALPHSFHSFNIEPPSQLP